MNEQLEYTIRKGTSEDFLPLKELYQKVAAIPGGLARSRDEITDTYIHTNLTNALHTGLIFVAEYHGKLIGSILAWKLEQKVFAHVLSQTSILVDPDFQGKGIGSKLIATMLDEIKQHKPDILRVELMARESNPAIKLYERMGFRHEGAFEKRILGITGTFEADIPMAWFNPNFDATAIRK